MQRSVRLGFSETDIITKFDETLNMKEESIYIYIDI
jgi:hypothetical protein